MGFVLEEVLPLAPLSGSVEILYRSLDRKRRDSLTEVQATLRGSRLKQCNRIVVMEITSNKATTTITINGEEVVEGKRKRSPTMCS